MIVTLTAHPSIDRTVSLSGLLERGAVLRVASTTTQAAGKGVNISRAAVTAGVETLAVLPSAEHDPFLTDLADAGVPCLPVGPAGPVRMNLTITEPDGTTTKLNASADPAAPALLADLASALLDAAATADWVVLAGSLPPGAPVEWYAGLVAALRRTPARIAVDTSDEPLTALVARLAGAAPHLMKPNAEELASFTGTDAAALEASPILTAEAARTLVGAGVEAVLATLGGAGAVLVTAEGAWHATPPPTTVVSTVGAGDSSLFGYLLGDERQLPPAERLALAVAYGSAAAALPGTTIPTPSQVRPQLVSVRTLDLTEGTAR